MSATDIHYNKFRSLLPLSFESYPPAFPLCARHSHLEEIRSVSFREIRRFWCKSLFGNEIQLMHLEFNNMLKARSIYLIFV
jgi:hypothetical protein